MNKHQVTFKGKIYGIYSAPGMTTQIRSESNPDKTPYLKVGSSLYVKVLAAAAPKKYEPYTVRV